MRLAGVELYSDDVARARSFYLDVLGLTLADEDPGHYAKFNAGPSFVCAERKGSEPYPSAEKAVVFFEVDDVESIIRRIGVNRIVQQDSAAPPRWAVLHDPEGHNILLLAKG
jgi:predicted enzyme related to lactoylglutathione lyase